MLKPLKGCDAATEACLRSWFAQQYAGPTQMLFGVAEEEDAVCEVVRRLSREFPAGDAQLVVCGPLLGANAKVSQLVELERLASYELLVISDADVLVPPDLLTNIVAPLCKPPLSAPMEQGAVSVLARADSQSASSLGARGPSSSWRSAMDSVVVARRPPEQAEAEPTEVGVSELLPAAVNCEVPRSEQPACGLVCCFYRLANPSTLAMQWEAIAINADFWSQVLQARTLKPIDFALGAVMAIRRQQLQEIGGFAALADCLADDYQLGNRIVRRGYSIALAPVVAECWSAPLGWAAVWKHQLRWARTIRVCQPLPYFFSLLSNATFWPLLWLAIRPGPPAAACALACFLVRILTALNLQHRLTGAPPAYARGWLVPVKDLLQAAIWLLAFLGNRIEWRGQRMRLRRDGTLVRG